MSKPVYQDMSRAIERAQRIAIAGHVNPDGDAVGACLAMAMALDKMGKTPIVCIEDYHEKLNIIPGCEFLYKGDLDRIEADLLVALDCADARRLGVAQPLLNRLPESICIDHHDGHEGFGTINDVDAAASSTSEMLFGFLDHLGIVDARIASALYAGIVYDTGGFRHAATSPWTHVVVSKCLAWRIPAVEIYDAIMRTRSLAEAKVLGVALKHLYIEGQYPIAVVYVTETDLARTGASAQDMDGVVEYALSIRGVEAAVFVYPLTAGHVKVSLRAKQMDVGQVARRFGGGGHKLAAGCSFCGDHASAFAAVLPVLKKVFDENE